MPTRMKDLTLLPGFVLRACLSPLSFHTVVKSARLRRGEAARRMAVCWFWQRGSGRIQISAHKERVCLGRLPAGRPFCARAGGQCGPRTWRRRRMRGSFLPRSGEELRLGVLGCRRSAVAVSGHARDAASGVGRPVGGRTAAWWEEDGTVGSHCAPRP